VVSVVVVVVVVVVDVVVGVVVGVVTVVVVNGSKRRGERGVINSRHVTQ